MLPEGYELVGITGDNAPDGSITLVAGDNKSCTITNRDIQPELKVIKQVINDNGGSLVAGNFTLNVTGPVPARLPSLGLKPSGITVTLNVGTYAVSESVPAGYSATYSSNCSGTIDVGDVLTCTITNDDIAPALHLRKTVINDDGGTALVTDWTLNADGLTPLSGHDPVDSGAYFSAGTYTLSEIYGPDGYTASAWSCVGGVQVGNQITLGLDESATCTITNDDIELEEFFIYLPITIK